MQLPIELVVGAVVLIGTILFGVSAVCMIFFREIEPKEVLD